MRAYIWKVLKEPTGPVNKEPYWVLQNLDDIMAFMMCGMHLGRKVYTVRDLSDLVQPGIDCHLQTPQNIGKGSSRALKTS